MPRSHHRTHKIESLEAMILMSASTTDGIADADVDLPTGGPSFGLAGDSEAFTTGGVSFDTEFESGFEFSGTSEGASEGGGATGSQSADDHGGIVENSGNPGVQSSGGSNSSGLPVDLSGAQPDDSIGNVGTESISGDNLGSVVDTTAVNTDGEPSAVATADGSLAAASGAGNDGQIIQGTNNAEWLSVENGSASVAAGAGDDSLHSSVSDSVLDGGDGLDTFYVYEGTSADFTIQQSDGGVIVSGVGVNGGTVANTLISVERIIFNDREIDLTSLSSSVTQPTLASQILGVLGFFGGSPTDDMIDGTNGDDEFYASAGNDQIDGGDGSDTLYMYGGSYLNPLGASTSGIQPAGGIKLPT